MENILKHLLHYIKETKMAYVMQMARKIWRRPHRIREGNRDLHLTFLEAIQAGAQSVQPCLYSESTWQTHRGACYGTIDRYRLVRVAFIRCGLKLLGH